MIQKTKDRIKSALHFLGHDIWRINSTDLPAKKISLYNIIKAFILAFRNIDSLQLITRASALTYSTLLSIFPLLAVLFAIARGFGFQNIVQSQLFTYFAGQEIALSKGMAFIDKSIEYAQGGVFLGVGIILLLYTVLSLLSSIEDNFNIIWQIKKGRTYYRMFTDYLALIIIAPVFLICNAGISILLNTGVNSYYAVDLLVSPLIKIVPFLIVILLFTLLFIYIPNTKVKFSSALLGGIFTGICFQLFQTLYISGQIWIAKYNAIYGSFAALPLLLLWLQITWFMILFGVELSFAYQNVNKFSFEHETSNISRRYKDFIFLLITTLIVKRFATGEKPYTADELSETYKIPTQLTSDTIFFLQQIGVIVETPTEDSRVVAYIPALDINQISVSYLFGKVDLFGSEDFMIDTDLEFRSEWDIILKRRGFNNEREGEKLLKDL